MKLTKIFSIAIAGMMIISACKKDTDPALITDFKVNGASDKSSGEHQVGETISFTFVASDNEELERWTIQESFESTDNIFLDQEIDGASKSLSFDYDVPATLGGDSLNAGDQIFITISVYDNEDDNAPATKEYTINIHTPGQVSEDINNIVGAQAAAEGGYFSSETGEVYLSGDFDANIDVIDVTFAEIDTTGTDKGEFISPDYRSQRGLTKNTNSTVTTYFKSSSKDKSFFDSVTNADDLAYISISQTDANKFTVVQQGNVYEFITEKGKKGLIYISDRTPGNNDFTGTVTFDVKVEK